MPLQNENSETQTITSESLWGLLFPACSCHVDTERGHFIRRTAGNNLAHAIVATNETADWVKAHCAGEHIYIQRIDEDGLSYSVIWDATEWSLSDERRRTLRANHLASDISFLHKKAEELRIEMIADALSKAKLFTKQKAFEVAAAITSQGEEVYLNKSRQLNDALKGAFNNINCYFPIEEVLRIVDTRGLLEKLNQENQPQQDEQKPTEEMSEGSSTPQSQDGQGYYQECNLTPTAGG
jgi:hypothetical protein